IDRPVYPHRVGRQRFAQRAAPCPADCQRDGRPVLSACLILTSIQLTYWRNSLTIFQHAVHVTENNYAAYDCLGRALQNVGRKDGALAAYTAAVAIEPYY